MKSSGLPFKIPYSYALLPGPIVGNTIATPVSRAVSTPHILLLPKTLPQGPVPLDIYLTRELIQSPLSLNAEILVILVRNAHFLQCVTLIRNVGFDEFGLVFSLCFPASLG